MLAIIALGILIIGFCCLSDHLKDINISLQQIADKLDRGSNGNKDDSSDK